MEPIDHDLDKLDKETENYQQMIDEMRRSHPDEWPDIVDIHGYGDVDLMDIMEDLL